MENRFVLALVLSALILIVYSYWFAPKPTPEQAQQAQQTQQPSQVQPVNPAPTAPTPVPQADTGPSRDITVKNDLWTASFTSRGALAKEWVLQQMPNGKILRAEDRSDLKLFNAGDNPIKDSFRLEFPGNPELTARINSVAFETDAPSDTVDITGNEYQLNFTYNDPTGLHVKKSFTFFKNRFDLRISLEARNGDNTLPVRLQIGPGFGDATAKATNRYTGTPPQAMVAVDNRITRLTQAKDKSGIDDLKGPINWAAVSDHYFAFIVVPDTAQSEAQLIEGTKTGLLDKDAFHPLIASLPIGQSATIYVGPKERVTLSNLSAQLKNEKNLSVDLEDVIDYGMFSFIVKPIVPLISWSLTSLYKVIPNYGWAIIVLTILINLIFFPLKWKSSIAMKKMKDLQPRNKEIQDKMKNLKKDDPRYLELQKEQLSLMKEGNPLSGCLPMLIQMPIFWAIFIYLGVSIYVRQSPWLGWIHDLSSPDPYYILPIIMCISMVAQSALTPTPTGDAQAKINKYIMSYGMPIVLTVLFFRVAPSGLVIYWMFSNLVGVGQQMLINKLS